MSKLTDVHFNSNFIKKGPPSFESALAIDAFID